MTAKVHSPECSPNANSTLSRWPRTKALEMLLSANIWDKDVTYTKKFTVKLVFAGSLKPVVL